MAPPFPKGLANGLAPPFPKGLAKGLAPPFPKGLAKGLAPPFTKVGFDLFFLKVEYIVMSFISRPPPAIPLNDMPPPSIPIDDEMPPPLLPLHRTNLSTTRLTVIPGLTDPETIQQNMSDWQAPEYRARIKKLETQLQSQTQKFTNEEKIKLYIGKFALIAMDDARKMEHSLKMAGITSDKQIAIDKIVADFVKELHVVKAKQLPPALTSQLAEILDKKAKLEIENIERPSGLTGAIYELYINIFKMLNQQGIKGVFMLGKVLNKHKAITAKVVDKTYTTLFYIISSYLFSTLSSFLLYMLNPAEYMSDIGMSNYTYKTANITEIVGGVRRKHKTHKRKAHKASKAHKTNKRRGRK